MSVPTGPSPGRARGRPVAGAPVRPPLIVGLTGGIGSGKSTVGELFRARGVPVIDADEIAHEVVAPGQPGLDAVVEAFGPSVLDESGRLDRARMRALVFEQPERRRRLEGILHPRIRREMDRRIGRVETAYCLLAIPLLLESGGEDRVDRVLVVDTRPELQIRRTAARDGTSEETIREILAAQVDRRQRLARADDVIENLGDPRDLEPRVEALHRRYLEIARRRSAGG